MTKTIFLFTILVSNVCLAQQENLIRNDKDLQEQFDLAHSQNKKLLLFYSSPTCGPCKRLKDSTLNYPKIKIELEADYLFSEVEKDDGAENPVLDKYSVFAFPTMFFVDESGEILEKIVGFVDTTEMSNTLESVDTRTTNYLSLQKKFENRGNDILTTIDYCYAMADIDEVTLEFLDSLYNAIPPEQYEDEKVYKFLSDFLVFRYSSLEWVNTVDHNHPTLEYLLKNHKDEDTITRHRLIFHLYDEAYRARNCVSEKEYFEIIEKMKPIKQNDFITIWTYDEVMVGILLEKYVYEKMRVEYYSENGCYSKKNHRIEMNKMFNKMRDDSESIEGFYGALKTKEELKGYEKKLIRKCEKRFYEINGVNPEVPDYFFIPTAEELEEERMKEQEGELK